MHKSSPNGFPRSDLVKGNVVTHRICCPAWLSPDWPQLAPPAEWITDSHLCHFLSIPPIPLPPYFNDPRFTKWLEKLGTAKKCTNTTQCGRDKQKKTRAAQKAPTALCILSHAFICSSLLVITRALARTQRCERSGREKRGNGGRKRSRRWHSAAGDRVGVAGPEEERAEKKTWWLSLSSEVNTQLYSNIPELVDLKIQYNHSLLWY